MSSRVSSYHFIGIGGIGMSALATILLQQGKVVSGSDLKQTPLITKLMQQGAEISLGHHPQNIPVEATIVYSSAIASNNPEFAKAKEGNAPLIHRSKLLKQVMEGKKTLLISGTHGKTTTTTLLTSVLREGGKDPSFVIGGIDNHLKTNGSLGQGEYFIAEGDESDGSFLNTQPFAGIVTNIGADHLDYYGSFQSIEKAFHRFFQSVSKPDLCFWCGDDPSLKNLSPQGVSYGFQPHCQVQISNYRQENWSSFFTLKVGNRTFSEIELALPGKHNVLNATAVFSLAYRIGIEEKMIRKAFQSFKGVARRGDIKHLDTLLLIDDYAHHPTEVCALLQSVRPVIKERRLIFIHQPHRYTRTKECLNEYSKAFELADELILTDIYSAGELPIPGVSVELLIEKINKYSTLPVHYIPRDELLTHCIENIRPHDVILTAGAGDITHLHKELYEHFIATPPTPYRVGVICGGRSNEHTISLKSAEYVVNNLKEKHYRSNHFLIDERGCWSQSLHFKKLKTKTPHTPLMTHSILEAILECDILLPILHGPYGEDGMVQGFLETLDKPYIGPDHRSAALCTDKVKIKRLAREAGIPTLPFVDFSLDSWQENPDRCVKLITSTLTYPLMVKPVHGGSSKGLTKVHAHKELRPAIHKAFSTDTHILCENAIVAREIEFAVLGNHQIETPPPGEICTQGRVYDYEKKYSKSPFQTHARAPLSQKLQTQGRAYAEKLYQIAGCHCFARIDFFLENEDTWWFNEVNPTPGFTSISLYPSIWKEYGVSASDLIDRWMILALQRTRQQRRTLGQNEKVV